MIFDKIILVILLFISSILYGKDSVLNEKLSYSANKIKFIKDQDQEFVLLSENAKLQYGKTLLTADTIKFNRTLNIAVATYKLDTIYDPETGGIDSVYKRGVPTVIDEETVTGDYIAYNLKTKRGKIKNARTVIDAQEKKDKTYFSGGQFYKTKGREFYGTDCSITSCKSDPPHYHFHVDSIIIDKDDWVYGKPVTFYIDELPLMWFPMIFYRRITGRQSGLIIPSYKYSSEHGNGIKELGYFWDVCSYMDYTLLLDYYDYKGFKIDQKVRIRKRGGKSVNKYPFKIDLRSRYYNNYRSKEWYWTGIYEHTFSPSMRFLGKLDYVTKTKLVRDEYSDRDKLVDDVTSSLNFNKKWHNSGDNFSISSAYIQYIDTSIVKYTLPNLRYVVTKRKPFKETDYNQFFRNIGFGGNLRLHSRGEIYKDAYHYTQHTDFNVKLNQSTKVDFKQADFNLDYIDKISISSFQNFKYKHSKGQFIRTKLGDSFFSKTSFDSSKTDKSVTTGFTFTAEHKILKYLKAKQSLNFYNDLAFRYYNSQKEIVDNGSGLWRNYFTLSSKINTHIYGIFSPDYFFLRRIRHTFIPEFELFYRPDNMSRFFYAYQDTYFDKFAISEIGSSPGKKNLKLNYSFQNIGEVKVATDSLRNRLKVIKFLSWKIFGNIDFAKDSNNFSDISNKLSSEYNYPLYGRYLSLSVRGNLGFVLSPYDKEGHYLNPEFQLDKKFLRFQSYDYGYKVSMPFKFSGFLNKNLWQEDEDEWFSSLEPASKVFSNWDLDFGGKLVYDYKKNFHNPGQDRLYMNLRATLQPTKNWSVNYNASYNFIHPQNVRKVSSSTINVKRNLHCWEGKFEWDLKRQGFFLEIRVTSDLFRDIKYEKNTKRIPWHY